MSTLLSKTDFLIEELESLRAKSLERQMNYLESSPSFHFQIRGQKIVNFSSNNYLDLAQDPRVVAASKKALDDYGAGGTSSRLLAGSLDVHRQLEQSLANLKGSEDALVFSSGYHVNLGVIPSLVGMDDVVIMDRLCHASLIDGIRLSGAKILIYSHIDMNGLERCLVRAQKYRRRLIVTDSIFSMDGDVAPLPDLVELAEKHHALTYVDEAHATGVLGDEGRGALEHFGLESRVDVVMGNLAKSLGSHGGFVCGSRDLIRYIYNRARTFIYTTALPASCAAAALEAIKLMREEPWRIKKVNALSEQLRQELKVQGWNTLSSSTPIIPVLIGSSERTLTLSRKLYASGFYCPAVRPPTVPRETGRLRISLTAGHSEEDIQKFLEVMGTNS